MTGKNLAERASCYREPEEFDRPHSAAGGFPVVAGITSQAPPHVALACYGRRTLYRLSELPYHTNNDSFVNQTQLVTLDWGSGVSK